MGKKVIRDFGSLDEEIGLVDKVNKMFSNEGLNLGLAYETEYDKTLYVSSKSYIESNGDISESNIKGNMFEVEVLSKTEKDNHLFNAVVCGVVIMCTLLVITWAFVEVAQELILR